MQAAAGGRRWRGSSFLGGGAGGCAAAVRSGKAGRLWALCRWAGLALVRGHRGRRSAAGVVIWCGAGGLVLPGAGGRRCDLLRLRCAGVVIVATAATPSGWRAADPAGRAGGQAGRCGKRKRPGRRRVVRCCSGLLSALAVRSAAPGASRCISWAAGSAPCSGAWLLSLALIRAQRFRLHLIRLHGLRWRCSIRCVFVPPPEGSDSPLYRVVP